MSDHTQLKKVSASGLQNMCIRPTKSIHLTYKTVHPTFTSFASDLQKLCIRPTKVVHPTYKICASDLRKLCIRPMCATGTSILMVAQSTTYWLYLQFLHRSDWQNRMYIRPTAVVGPMWRRSEVSLDESTVERKCRRTEVTLPIYHWNPEP